MLGYDRRSPLRTYSLIMGAIVVVLGLVYLCWSTVAYGKFVEEKVLAEARTLSVEAASAWDYINEAQDAINYNADGTYDFKGVYCTVAGKSIARKFTMRSQGYEISYVRDNPRSAHDAPDAFESRALAAFANSDDSEYYAVEREGESGPVFRYLVPLKAEFNCLQCHGEPAGEPDVTGHAREGMVLGDLAGAVSISIPMQAYQSESQERVLQAMVFVVALLVAAIIVVRLALRRLVVEPLERENETLHDENKMKTDFLDSVSHDMRTPLSSIIAFTDLWEEKLRAQGKEKAVEPDDEEALMLAEIRANSRILLNMVGNTLDASRLESGRFAFSFQELDVADVLQSVIVAIGPVAKKRDVVITRRFDMDVPLVVTDEAALQKIVMNLVSNAVKFSPDDGEVVVVMEPAQDGGVSIAVLDRGPGISEADRCRIFERFAQATEGAKGPTGGVGLGLYVSATLAEALGVKLEVAAREGGGSIFRLYVPSEPPRIAGDDSLCGGAVREGAPSRGKDEERQ